MLLFVASPKDLEKKALSAGIHSQTPAKRISRIFPDRRFRTERTHREAFVRQEPPLDGRTPERVDLVGDGADRNFSESPSNISE